MELKIYKIIEELKSLTLLEAVSLVKEIEKVFEVDISSFNQHQINTVSNANDSIEDLSSAPLEEKTSFDVILSEVPADKKIAILKAVRNATGLGLKESKEIVDNVPRLIKESVTKDESESLKKEFESAGAKITIK